METKYQVTGEVIPLPAPLASAVRADLLSRLNHCLARHISFLRTPSGSLDWRIAALEAQAQVYALRTGNPLPFFKPAR